MWMLALVSWMIITPCVRSFLEQLFMELSYICYQFLFFFLLVPPVLSVLLPLVSSKKKRWIVSAASVLFTYPSWISSSLIVSAQDSSSSGPCQETAGATCINNPADSPDFGTFIRAPGHCSIFGSAYVDVPGPFNILPGNYNPTSVIDAAAATGGANDVSQWSVENQESFKTECPLLHRDLNSDANTSTSNSSSMYLCCTEDQFEGMKNQLSALNSVLFCDSCLTNIKNTICQTTCSPDNSMFTDVKQIRPTPAASDAPAGDNVTEYVPIESMEVYVGNDYVRDLHNFCIAELGYTTLCKSANCDSALLTLTNMGLYKFGDLGSPQLMTFTEFNEDDDSISYCTCDALSNNTTSNCFNPIDTKLDGCFDVCGSCAVNTNERTLTQSCIGDRAQVVVDSDGGSGEDPATTFQSLWDKLNESAAPTNYKWLNTLLITLGLILIAVIIVVSVFGYKCCFPAESYVMNTNTTTAVSKVDTFIAAKMEGWASFLSHGKNAKLVAATALVGIIAASSGLVFVDIETDPVKLWVASSSEAYQNRNLYGELVRPFYRTEQVIMVTKDGNSINRESYLREGIRLQQDIESLVIVTSDYNVSLSDICWKASGGACTVNGITQYFQNNLTIFEMYAATPGAIDSHLTYCLDKPVSTSDLDTCNNISQTFDMEVQEVRDMLDQCTCFSDWGAPMDRYTTYVGDFPEDATEKPTLFASATAMISTSLVLNNYDKSLNEKAIAWERGFIQFMKEEVERNSLFTITFMAETSIEDEIEHESESAVIPAALSYVFMLVYVTLGLGRWSIKGFWKHSKFSIGFLGVLAILFSVTSTMGIFCYAGIKLQLVILEVVPFLTLAIGVDNIFLIVNGIDREENSGRFNTLHLSYISKHGDDSAIVAATEEYVKSIVSSAFKSIGPSIVLATVSEAFVFAFGCVSPMPAVLWFAAFSSVSVLINFMVQCTLFLSIVIMDKRREVLGYNDVLCCVKSKDGMSFHTDDRAFSSNDPSEASSPEATSNQQEREDHTDITVLPTTAEEKESFKDKAIESYANVLARPLSKAAILISVTIAIGFSIYAAESLPQGLPQQEAMPSNSYMVSYFDSIDKYLATGPPVYFVVEGGYGQNAETLNITNRKVESTLCREQNYCNDKSVPNILNILGSNPDVSRISRGSVYSWLDDFFLFVDPEKSNGKCCRLGTDTNRFIQTTDDETTDFKSCLAEPSVVSDEDLPSLFSMFASANANANCPVGGGSKYQGQFSIDRSPIVPIPADEPQLLLRDSRAGEDVTAATFMTLTEPCPTQEDFINTYKRANVIAQYVSEESGVSVWPYSIFFVFFDQYLTIVRDTFGLVGGALAAIFIIHVIYFAKFWIPLIVTLTIASIVICVVGLMGPLDIYLNGLSLVNLIIAAGVSVEFVSHYARAFVASEGSANHRMKAALKKVLTSVVFGITITKVVGLSALTLADSRIFIKYYFRMYLAIVLVGFVHGLVVLPVLLSVYARACGIVKHYRGKDLSNEGASLSMPPSPASSEDNQFAIQLTPTNTKA